MKLPRDLSGEELVKNLCRRWEYRQVHQVGSHIILETSSPGHQRIAVPAHNPLRVHQPTGLAKVPLRSVNVLGN
jgi:predicted RNA binding protein YcfA (HicA-like mRNA interferase family)